MSLRAFTTVLRKELREGLRERRALIGGLLLGPLMGPAMLAIIMSFTLERSVDEGDKTVDLTVINGAIAPQLMQFLRQHQIEITLQEPSDRPAMEQAISDGTQRVGLVIADDFGSALQSGRAARVWVVADGSDNAGRADVSRVRSAISAYSQTIAALRLRVRGVDPAIVRPLAILESDLATPSGRAILILGMMTYFLLFATLMGGLHIAIDATAGERERGSLEPLLSLPVSRSALAAGKLCTSALFMATSLAIAIVAFATMVQLVPLEKVGMRANLTPIVCLQIYATMLPFAALGAGIMSIVASFTKSFREAQSYTSIAMLAPTLPIVIAVMNPMPPSYALMLVPSLAQHLMVTGLIKGEAIVFGHWLVATVSTLLLAFVAFYCVALRYRSEKLLG